MQIIVFFLLGPIAVVLAALCWAWSGPSGLSQILFVIAMVASTLSFPISGFLGFVDACLALVISKFLNASLTATAGAILLRALLTAAIGAIILHELALMLTYDPPEVTFWTRVGAAYAAICSLLSNDWKAMGHTQGPGDPTSTP